jgi:hypothetical protein
MNKTIMLGRASAFPSSTDAGMTKLEYIATQIFAAMHTTTNAVPEESYAVLQAHNLLAELNKEEE